MLGMDSRAFFLLLKNIIEIRQNPIFEKKFLLGEDYSIQAEDYSSGLFA